MVLPPEISSRDGRMILLMVLTQLYGVAQLALVGWVARVVRLRVLLLAALAGTYAAAPAALLLEAGWTRAVAALSGQSLVEASVRASWTVDPLIEECAKLAPLLLLWLLVRSPRRQWGGTDLVLAGAALGAGFGLAEQLLRFAAHAGQAVHLDAGGWAIPAGPASAGVPGVARTLGSWLPAGVATGGLPDAAGSFDLHLVWSAVAGLGLALALRRGATTRARLAGLALIALAVADHAAANTQGVAGSLARTLATPFTAARPLAWAWPLAALAAAIWLDRQRPATGVVLACERRRPRSLGLARLALAHPPWSLQAVWGFVRLRRAWRRSARWGEPDLALGEALDLLAPALDRASGWKGSRIWRAATRRLRRRTTPAGPPAPRELLTTARGLLAVAWLLLLLPPVLYLLVGGVPSLAGVQRAMGTPPRWWLVVAAAVAGAAWTAWSLAVALRRLPQARRHPAAEVPASATLLLLVRAGALLASLAALWLLALGDAPGDQALPSAQILDAGGQATLLLVLLLALAANAAAPPFTPAPPGGGEAVIGTAVVAAVVGGIGVALLDDDEEGDGDGAAAARQPVPGLPYSAGELARLAERHAGAAGRPTRQEIERAIASAAPRPVRGHNAVRFDDQGVTVVVDRDLPWRSTAWFAGR
ncbi:MAG TPA: PrsW family glutamic-type intramembrane protease [Actinomycetota bacterium]